MIEQLADRVYNTLKINHRGAIAGVPMKGLAEYLNVSERKIRYAIKHIRESDNFDLVVEGDNNGYYVIDTDRERQARRNKLINLIKGHVKELKKLDRLENLNYQGEFKEEYIDFVEYFKNY